MRKELLDNRLIDMVQWTNAGQFQQKLVIGKVPSFANVGKWLLMKSLLDLWQVACCVFSVIVLVTVIGCSSDLSTVKGKVTLDGEPLPDAFVEFTPQVEGGSMSYGRTNANGNYQLMFSLNKSGAMPGENIVRITTFDVGDMGKANVPERVPNRYNGNSELRVEVEPNKTNVLNFDLKTNGAKISQPKLNAGS